MQLQSFRYSHPLLYQRLLVVALTCTLGSGLYVSLAHASSPSPASLFTPPINEAYIRANTAKTPIITPATSQTEQSNQAQAVVLGATLPGGDGTGNDPVQLGHKMNARWFGEAHWPALYKLWMRESGWNPGARNPNGGACGIPQALPCSKIPDMSLPGQLHWGLSYIERRYGTPSAAWSHWQRHGWY